MAKVTKEEWLAKGANRNWSHPKPAPWWIRRIPIFNAFRWRWIGWQMHKHYEFWRSLGAASTGYDEWALYGIYRGWI